ncbi:MAG TPA: hypothetical protein DEP84_15225 [Chloroflexi bacterium]|nr:hypothetical protein [Chloroflexota bacterium]
MTSDDQSRARVALPWFDLFMALLLVAFLAGGLISGYLFYQSIRSFVARTQVVNLPSLKGSVPAPYSDPAMPQGSPPETPPRLSEVLPVPGETAVPAPAMTSAMNILIMGIDKRDGEGGPFRTDTMLVLHVDPVARRAGMLSIPRDLLVQLPDYGYGRRLDRVNTANVWGDVYKYPGGGPALAKKTIENNFGIPVDRYVLVDFNGFENFIDLIDGIDIDVPQPITDHEYPTADYGYMTIHFEAGRQHMDGETALIYARTRKSSSDFARAARQQQVILAVRSKVLSLNIIPSLTPANLVRIARQFGESVRTDLSIEEMFTLARTVNDIPDGGIRQAVIDSSMVYDGEGYTLIGRWDKIYATVADLFGTGSISVAPPPTPVPSTPTPTRAVAVLTDTGDLPAAPGPGATGSARIEVRNGTTIANLEERGAVYLQQLGLFVTGIGPAERDGYQHTVLIVYNQNASPTVATLSAMLNVTSENVILDPGSRTDVDILVILGSDVERLLPSG